MTAFYCPTAADLRQREDGGCGVVFTPDHDHRPRRNPDQLPWAWCPDCQRGADDG